jgi:predicted AAA+ superfamily ATPase
MTTAKFYLFDPGVTNFLLGRNMIAPKTKEFGSLFEQMIFCELKTYLDYKGLNDCLFYWRSTSQFEVDFLIRNKSDQWIGVEVKSSANPSNYDYKGLIALEEDLPLKKKIVVCLTDKPRITAQKIEILPLQLFLEMLWHDEIV